MWTLGRYGEEERGRKIDVQVDGQCECGLEGDLEKRRAEGRSTCRWMDNVNVDLRKNGLSGGENAKPDYVKATGENHRSRVEV